MLYRGEPHDIENIEPALIRPDPVLAIPQEERGAWVVEAKDYAVIGPRSTPSPRYFLRVNMPFRVEGREAPLLWGVWVEVAEDDYKRIHELWTSPDQHREPPFRATLANDLENYPATSGLPGTIRLQSPTTVPILMLDPGDHPLAKEQQTDVSQETVLRWLRRILHP